RHRLVLSHVARLRLQVFQQATYPEERASHPAQGGRPAPLDMSTASRSLDAIHFITLLTLARLFLAVPLLPLHLLAYGAGAGMRACRTQSRGQAACDSP